MVLEAAGGVLGEAREQFDQLRLLQVEVAALRGRLLLDRPDPRPEGLQPVVAVDGPVQVPPHGCRLLTDGRVGFREILLRESSLS